MHTCLPYLEGMLMHMSSLVGATTPQEADISEDIPDWREPVDKSSAPVSPEVIDIMSRGNYGVGV